MPAVRTATDAGARRATTRCGPGRAAEEVPTRVRSSAPLPEPRPDRFGEVALGDHVALVVDRQRELRQGAGGRPGDRPRRVQHVEGRLVAGAEQPMLAGLVEPDGTPDV